MKEYNHRCIISTFNQTQFWGTCITLVALLTVINTAHPLFRIHIVFKLQFESTSGSSQRLPNLGLSGEHVKAVSVVHEHIWILCLRRRIAMLIPVIGLSLGKAPYLIKCGEGYVRGFQSLFRIRHPVCSTLSMPNSLRNSFLILEYDSDFSRLCYLSSAQQSAGQNLWTFLNIRIDVAFMFSKNRGNGGLKMKEAGSRENLL